MALPPIQTIDLTCVGAFEAALAAVECDGEARLLERLTRMSLAGQVFAGSEVWLGSRWTAGWYDEPAVARIRAAAGAAADLLGELERRERELEAAGGVSHTVLHVGREAPPTAGPDVGGGLCSPAR